jgi:L-ascorbate metabolism protein UlaG (beta-lactamase superfamily)
MIHDRRRSFGGYIIETPSATIYHGGDTAYFEGFKEIGERFKIDIAILPIGAYDSPSGRNVHMNPEEALEAFSQLGAKHMIPMHYGAYRLSYEPVAEPPMRLLTAALDLGVSERVHILREGFPAVFQF